MLIYMEKRNLHTAKGLLMALLLILSTMNAMAQAPTKPLKVELEAEEGTTFKLDEGVELFFSVSNEGKKKQQFCIYMTPFEGFKGDILEVKDAAGNEVPYQGMMVKRGAPTKDDYYKILRDQTLPVAFNLLEAYPIDKPGTYTVQFKGRPAMNALPDSNVLEITVQ